MATKSRGSVSASLGQAVIAVSVLAVLIIAVTLFFSLGREAQDPVPPAVDYESVVEHLRTEYPYDVPMPDVPENWRATSVDYGADAAGNWWKVGFVIGTNSFVGLEQSDGEVNSMLDDRLNDYEPDGSTMVDGERWDRMRRDGRVTDYALVNVSIDGVATVVYGSQPYEELVRFIEALDS
ncbi:MAG TPA: DUF4245 domain-containing protein [Jiangellaceae bacterium]